MQRSSRFETLRNALVVSLALGVSYAAPRLASSPEGGPRTAASAYGLDLATLERSITSDENDGGRAERRWHAAAAATRAERSHRKALERALEAAARRAAAEEAAADAHDAASDDDDGDDDDEPEVKGSRAPAGPRTPEERPHPRRR